MKGPTDPIVVTLAGQTVGVFMPVKPWEPVVKVPRRIETGEAPGWQGATMENIGNIRRRSNAAGWDASSVECSGTFTTGS